MKTNIPPLQAESYYHVYNRGINGENIFPEERNYQYFLDKYQQFVAPVADLLAYCLLKNHFHFLIRTKSESIIAAWESSRRQELQPSGPPRNYTASESISRAFASYFKSYAQSVNLAYSRTGALFEEPFRRIEVSSDSYLSQLVQYIHLNPQTHGFVDDFRTYSHSSYQTILNSETNSPDQNTILDWFGGRDSYIQFHLNN
jgi:hypothetical protein